MFPSVVEELHDEYTQDHNFPWVIGYSGGKDSTLLVHLVFEMLVELFPSQRVRPVHVIANDTLVESPLVVRHLEESITEIKYGASALGLPITVSITRPETNESFWVNLIGRGYPSPNRVFRWCTNRMKIRPTIRYITNCIQQSNGTILLLGVRSAESTARARIAKRHSNGERLNPHSNLANCKVFRPILDLSTDEVWEYLATNNPPWGGTHRKLIALYRNAGGGECPVITEKEEVASCGTTSSRFGCWTCTVVKKDRSLEGFVESGFTEFGPLLNFRDWLTELRDDPERRQITRRDGRLTYTASGSYVMGPFTVHTRMEILDKLLKLEEEVGMSLISPEECDEIKSIWVGDLTETPKPMSIFKQKR